jgi:hypothetical protein
MKNYESVLAFGDSHVAGCELSNKYSLQDYISKQITIEEADAPGKELAFPKIIADALNIPCYNYAMSGGSNSRSLRLLTRAIQEQPNSLVLFGYTSTDRSEMFYPEASLGKDIDNFLQLGLQWEGVFDNTVNDFYIKHLYPHNNLKELMFCVNAICSNFTNGYLHLPLFPEDLPKIDNMFTFEGHSNYLTWCQKRKFKKLPFYHYEQDAHDVLADLILKEI